MKLKTLKDIRSLRDDCFVDWHVLRQEAIKWIKNYDADIESNKNHEEVCFGEGARAFIKMFFNLTEEDLK